MSSNRQARRSFFLAGVLVTVLAFVLAACGANTSTGSGTGSSGSTSTTPTASASQTGCPSTTAMSTVPAPANVVLKPSNNNSTTSAKVGDVIEIDLPFGQAWSGPVTSQGELTL